MSLTPPPSPRPPGGSGGGSPLLTPGIAVRIALLGGLAVVLLGVLVVRLWFLQVVSSEQYAERAEGNRLRTVITEAPRGNILDRNGRVLVSNTPSSNLVARPRELSCERPDAPSCERRGRVLRALAPKLGTSVAALEAKMDAGEDSVESVVLAQGVDSRLELYLAERRRQFPGVALRQSFERDYRRGALAAQVLGTTGAITPEQLEEYRERGYVGNESVGQTGIEAQYEEWLRGTPGRVQVEVDAAGEPVGRGIVSEIAPTPGRDVQLGIDLPTQIALERALERQVSLGLAEGAAGVAMDPRTGEVLAIASLPDYDPSAYVEGDDEAIEKIGSDARNPLFNRAIAGAYPPGSTFKAVSAAAALRKGYVTPETLLDSPAQMELYGQEFHNFRYTSHGLVAMPRALEVSSDTYFFQIGDRFYQEAGSPLQDEAARFGFGRPTGVDLPGESEGVLPTNEWKRRTFAGERYTDFDRQFRPGEIIQMAVGQGDLLVTPLQLARAYAALANGGTLFTPAIGRQVQTPGGEVLRRLSAGRDTADIAVTPAHLAAIRQGLLQAANGPEGTSTAVFANVPEEFTVAGKTGTAEQVGGEDHSWFAGYAPYDDPKIVVAVIIERGGTGASSAAPAVCTTIAAKLKFDPGTCGTGGAPN